MSEIERESDFAQAIRDQGIVEWLRDEAPAEPETPAVEPQPRDEQGRFTSAVVEDSAEEEVPADAGSEDSAEEPEGQSSDESTEELGDADDGDIVLEFDPDRLEKLLEKYGSLDKALEALDEAQSLIGRQGTELGELRPIKDQLEQMQRELQGLRLTQSYDWDTLIEEDPAQAAQMAVEVRDPVLFEKAMQAWGAESPFEAMMFMNELSQAAAQEAVNQRQPTDLPSEMAALQERHPDLPQMLPEIQKLAAERPLMAQALQPGADPRTRVQALEDLYALAKTRTSESETSTKARQIILRAKAEADAAVQDAEVVSATNVTVETPQPSGVDQFRTWFRGATGQPEEDE